MMPTPITTTSTAATAASGTAGTSRIPWKKAASASPKRRAGGLLVCIFSHSSSSNAGRGRVVWKASSSSRCRPCSSRSPSGSLIGSSDALLLDRFFQHLQSAVIQHFRGILAAAHQPADLVKAQPGVPQRDGVALALGQLRDVREQSPVLD